MNYHFVLENTAISNGISKSTRLLIGDLKEEDIILDYGCGLLRNANELLKHNKKVDILDTKNQLLRLGDKVNEYSHTFIVAQDDLMENHYDKILCSFVLNVIPYKEERDTIVQNIYKALKPNGIGYFEVRGNHFVKGLKHYEMLEDGGIIVGKGEKRTFQFPYTKDSFLSYLSSISHTKFSILKVCTTSDSIIIIAKKE